MTIWLTSDWHFGHLKIHQYEPGRPGNGPTMADAVAEHDEILINQHNSRVAPEDEVWVLGDVAMGDINQSLACCARMNGQKILVCGNHDRPAMTDDPDKRARWTQRYMEEGGFAGVLVVAPARSITIQLVPGLSVQASHYPYTGDVKGAAADRFADRRPVDLGLWLVHGHVHSAWKTRKRMINVGVDVWDYAPVTADVISGTIQLRECEDSGGHDWVRGSMGGVTPGESLHHQKCTRCPGQREGRRRLYQEDAEILWTDPWPPGDPPWKVIAG